jgi:hypothetical protein
MMEGQNAIFHLAIPSADLNASAEFYSRLGGRVVRRYDDRITLKFFGHQVVCHLSPDKIDPHPEIYPRHFGFTFTEVSDFQSMLSLVRKGNIEFFREPFLRFKDLPEKHLTFLLKDPSNNVLEFKHYYNPEMMY